MPQGSVLGPTLFIDYESPLESIIRKHGVEAHFYADDSQTYTVFKPNEKHNATNRTEKCIQVVCQGMGQTFLKFNDDKTELILFVSHHNLSKVNEIEIAIGDHKVKPSQQVCNIGATFDCEMNMDAQITNVCKSAWHQLNQI